MVRQSIKSAIAACVLVLGAYAGTALGHGRVSLEEDTCVRQVGENMVHLSAYQPQFDQAGHYCTDIPVAGDTYLVIDLVDQALRNMPVSMKVMREDAGESATVTQINADYYPDGVISGIGTLDKGLYSVVVTAEGIPPLNYHYRLRVEMVDYGKIARAWTGPVIALLLLSWLIYKLIQSGRLRGWFGSRRT
ncbi:hypothetical protein [Nitrosomonas halophila]|uniref:Uncharacterized protein n=1 Tax=Nitrosomonas halophila TaxID=44576 RepID=A0A1H3PWC1_9PROT|nr:hypothetical protein [Nitrosomonas halophila]SDZ04709.1 hypothetical protein SAMN05421881_11135 [Nitrosomonas halophila]